MLHALHGNGIPDAINETSNLCTQQYTTGLHAVAEPRECCNSTSDCAIHQPCKWRGCCLHDLNDATGQQCRLFPLQRSDHDLLVTTCVLLEGLQCIMHEFIPPSPRTSQQNRADRQDTLQWLDGSTCWLGHSWLALQQPGPLLRHTCQHTGSQRWYQDASCQCRCSWIKM